MSTSVRSSGAGNRGFSSRSRSGGHRTYRNQPRKHSSSSNFSSSHGNEATQGRSDGVYADAHFTYHITSLMGVLVRVVVTNGNMFEGILRSCSPSADVVLNTVHRLKTNDNGNQQRIDDILTENMLFRAKDIVHIEARDINVKKYKKFDFMTDSAISGYNGETEGRELTPWEADPDIAPTEEGVGLLDDNSTRWDPKDMLHVNETQFGVKSTFDSSMKDYTTELKKADSVEYKRRMIEAERLANEIDLENRTRKDNAFSTLTEEGKYSAVISETNINKYTESTESPSNQNDPVSVNDPSKKESSDAIDEGIVPDSADKIVNVATSNSEERVDIPKNSNDNVALQKVIVDESVKDEITEDFVSSEKQKISLEHQPKIDKNKGENNNSSPTSMDGKNETSKEIANLRKFQKQFNLATATSGNENSKKDSTSDDSAITDNGSTKSESLSEKKKSYKLNPFAKEFSPTSFSPKSKSSHSPSATTATTSTATSGIYQTTSNTSGSYQSKHRSKGRLSSNVTNPPGSFSNPGTTYNTQNIQGQGSIGYTEQPQVSQRFIAANAMPGYDQQMQSHYYSSVATVTQPVAMNFPPHVPQPIPTGSQQMSAVIPHSQIIPQHGIRHTNQNQQAIQQAINSQRYSMQGQQMPQQVASPSYNLVFAQRQVPANNNPTLTSQFMPSAGYYQYKQ